MKKTDDAGTKFWVGVASRDHVMRGVEGVNDKVEA